MLKKVKEEEIRVLDSEIQVNRKILTKYLRAIRQVKQKKRVPKFLLSVLKIIPFVLRRDFETLTDGQEQMYSRGAVSGNLGVSTLITIIRAETNKSLILKSLKSFNHRWNFTGNAMRLEKLGPRAFYLLSPPLRWISVYYFNIGGKVRGKVLAALRHAQRVTFQTWVFSTERIEILPLTYKIRKLKFDSWLSGPWRGEINHDFLRDIFNSKIMENLTLLSLIDFDNVIYTKRYFKPLSQEFYLPDFELEFNQKRFPKRTPPKHLRVKFRGKRFWCEIF